MGAASVHDRSTMGDERVVIVHDLATMPIASPVIPTPAITSEPSNPEPQSKSDSRAIKVKSGIRVPTRENRQRVPVHVPGIILRNVDFIGRCGFNIDRISVRGYVLLRR